ncbi:hypothetical protein [Hyalangium gracile]|uniref:hypothetical protein n=1 Tax=Hyalangium gracile TaxID=394092 RepID=UPI001CC9FDD7|nr:hypothetical protein [Hyalangium gracile]
MENIADFLFSRRAQALPDQGFAEILEELMWALDEEMASQIISARQQWLEGDNIEKARIALLMRDSFPYDSRDRLTEVLNQVRRKWPELEKECAVTLSAWDHSFGAKES